MNPCDPSLREIDHRDDLPEWMILHYRKVGVDILMEPVAFIGVLHAEYEQKFAAWSRDCHLIDPWHAQPADVYRDSQNAQAHLESAYWTAKNRLPNATFHRRLSLEAAPLFGDASLSLVHLDGNHSATPPSPPTSPRGGPRCAPAESWPAMISTPASATPTRTRSTPCSTSRSG
jgi:hypothetical protein